MKSRSFAVVILVVLLLTHAAPGQETAFHGKTLKQWAEQLNKGTSLERGRAATALGAGPFGKAPAPILAAALAQSDAHVRRCAILALGEMGPDAEKAVPALAALLTGKDKV